jgi:hypothetical protein
MKARKTDTRSRSSKFYDNNPDSKKKKMDYDKKYHSTEERKKYRAFLNKKNREAGTYGNGDGKDYDHDERKMISYIKNRSKK